MIRKMAFVTAAMLCLASGAWAGPALFAPPTLPKNLESGGVKGQEDAPFPTALALGSVNIQFEATKLTEVQGVLGAGVIQKSGDASKAMAWLCYTLDNTSGPQRLWLISGSLHRQRGQIASADLVSIDNMDDADATCPVINATRSVAVIDGKLKVGMSRSDVARTLGTPVAQLGDWLVFAYDGKTEIAGRPRPFDLTGRIYVRMLNGRVDRLSVWRTTTD